VLDAEINAIRQVGVEIRTNTRIDSIESLREQGYDAVFLALGAHASTKMRIPGEETPGVIDCMSLLRDVNLGKKVRLGKSVAVIGGGNAAIDASRTALRIKAKEVTIFYRRTRNEMPAASEEIREALDEGVRIEFLVAPSKIWQHNGHLKMEYIRMKLGEIDASGRRRPEPVAGSECEEEFDVIITAIGQRPEIPDQMGLMTQDNGTICADTDALTTDVDGVFAGGDAVSGPASVIEAIAAGRQAAISIDKYLGGNGVIDEKLAPPEDVPVSPEVVEEEEMSHRAEMPLLAVGKRKNGFDVVELGFTEEAATREAKRCLRCDLEED
jgi:NADPH-dependent glutamate synthase beta subunit-like oxidoreductase